MAQFEHSELGLSRFVMTLFWVHAMCISGTKCSILDLQKMHYMAVCTLWLTEDRCTITMLCASGIVLRHMTNI